MPRCITPLALLLLTAAVAAEEPKPKIRLAKDTTFVLEPLDKDGYVDYEAALNKHLKGTTTPETNAVVLLLKCFGPKPDGQELHPDFYEALGMDAPPAEGDYLKDHEGFFGVKRGEPGFESLEQSEATLRRGPWFPSNSAKHVEWLDANEQPLALAIEASFRRDYYQPMISRNADGSKKLLLEAPLPIIPKTRQVAAMLSLRATLKLGRGEIAAAFEDALAIHRLANLTSRGGSLIGLLAACVMVSQAHLAETAILSDPNCTSQQAMGYQSQLLKLPPIPQTADCFGFTDRLTFLNVIQTVQRKGLAGSQREFGNDPGGIETLAVDLLLNAVDWETTFRFVNSYYDKVEAMLRNPSNAYRAAGAQDIRNELGRMKAEVQDREENQKIVRDSKTIAEAQAIAGEKIGKIYVSLMLPAVDKLDELRTRTEQSYRNGVIAAALAAHRFDQGKFPERLGDLVPRYLQADEKDCFDSQSLIYRKYESGCIFYSVGFNGKDDGGKFPTDTTRGDDVGVRMGKIPVQKIPVTVHPI